MNNLKTYTNEGFDEKHTMVISFFKATNIRTIKLKKALTLLEKRYR